MTCILVIEDDVTILENILEVLRMEGFESRGAANGEEGIKQAHHYLPDLVICDIMMPKVNGYDVLLELRNAPDTSKIPFIFLTARTDRADMRRGMELGADDYVAKPFGTEELLAAIDARLARQATIAQHYEKQTEELRLSIVRTLPHEFRTPLTGIIGYSEMLLMDFDSFERDQVLRMLNVINRAGMRLFRQVENFLIYAQLELICMDEVRLEAMRAVFIDYPQTIIRTAASDKALDRKRADDLHINAVAGRARISEDNLITIISELVDNACKFSEPDKPIYVNAGMEDNYYVVSVRDYGRGMKAQQISEIGAYMQFERKIYEQQGMGFGLVIAKRLAEMHGGQMNIYSEPQEGTTVVVTLPAT